LLRSASGLLAAATAPDKPGTESVQADGDDSNPRPPEQITSSTRVYCLGLLMLRQRVAPNFSPNGKLESQAINQSFVTSEIRNNKIRN
jgi:hypothetical protein